MTDTAVQHAVRLWQSITTPMQRNEHWIEATLRSTAVEPDNVFEVIAIRSSPNGMTLDVACRCSDRLRASLAITTLKITISRILNSFNLQLKTVLTYQITRIDFGARAVDRASLAFIIYAPVSAATLGNLARLSGARAKLFRLEPRRLCRHVSHSEIVERVTPRLRSERYGAC